MIELPTEDVPIYQRIFEVEYSKELSKENIVRRLQAFRNAIERIQNCKFEELDNIFSKDPISIAKYLLAWLKFNFTCLQEETKDLNDFYNKDLDQLEREYWDNWLVYDSEYGSEENFIEDFKDRKKEYERHKEIEENKQDAISNCNLLISAIEIKDNKFIPDLLEDLSFPEEYKIFREILPEMIRYQKETGKHTFWKCNISKQFLKWYKTSKKRVERL